MNDNFVGGMGMSRTYGLYAPDKKRNLPDNCKKSRRGRGKEKEKRKNKE